METDERYGWTFPGDCNAETAEYMAVRSPLKYFVLDLVDERGELTYRNLAEETGMPNSYAANRLMRYAQRGLLHRSREHANAISRFTLTDHGISRLRWFRRQ